tara:strand:+ start:494 stop:1708 length:1215 start_codon:yes stop_codon:yes gene_type:complete
MGKLKQISPNQKSLRTVLVPFSGNGWNTVTGSSLTFTAVQRNATNGRAFSNLYSSFNLPATSAQSSTFNSTFTRTGFSGLNQDNIIVVDLPRNSYGELIDGRTIKLVIPNNTGTTYSLYSSYYEPEPYSSDNSPQGAYFGNPNVQVLNVKATPSLNATNIAFLFSDNIKKPQLATSNTSISTWADGWQKDITPVGYQGASADNFRFIDVVTSSNTPKAYAQSQDKPVGICYLDKGFVVITDPEIVSNTTRGFQFSGASSGGTNDVPYGGKTAASNLNTLSSAYTQIFFTSSTSASCSYYSFEKQYELSIDVTAESGEFYVTENQTASSSDSPYYGAGGTDTGIEFRTPYGEILKVWNLTDVTDAFITEVGLYDNNNRLLAIAKPDRPIKKPKNEPVTLTLKLKF